MKKMIALALVAALMLGAFAAPVSAAESVFHNRATIENNRYHNSGFNNQRPGQPGHGYYPQPGRPNHPAPNRPPAPPAHRPNPGRPGPNHRPDRHDSSAKWVGLGIGALAVIGAAIAHSNR